MPTCNRCNGKGTIQPFKALDPSRCPVCRGMGIVAPKKKYKQWPKGEGVWLHINTHEGITYMGDAPLGTAELNAIMERIENDPTSTQAASNSGHRDQPADPQDADADTNDTG